MGLLDNCFIPRRTSYIYFLIDCSKNMAGNIISSVNDAMDNACTIIEEINNENPDCNIVIKIIKIGDKTSLITLAENYKWRRITAGGDFFFGKALSILTKDVKNNFNSSNYDPIFILMTSSPSVDWWQPYLKRLYNIEAFDWGHKIAIKIGDNTDDEMLLSFTRDKKNIIASHNIDTLKNLIHLTVSYPEWYVGKDNYTGCSEDMTLIMSKAVELNGKDILYTPKIIHILNDYHAFNTNKALCFVLKTMQEDEGFIPLLNSDNWFLDSLNFINEIHKRTGIEILSIQHVLNAIGFALDHSIPVEYGLEKN